MIEDAAHSSEARLLIEGSGPRFPVVYRGLLATSTKVDIALTRLRIATLRLQPGDLDQVRSLRIVLTELTTAAWEVETHRALLNPRREPQLRALIEGIRSGRVEVRSAPLATWAPDFTLFHGVRTAPVALIGPHWLETGPGRRGPRMAFEVTGPDARRLASAYTRIWDDAYDVSPAVGRMLGHTLDALDRLTPSGDPGMVSAPQNWGSLPP